MADVFWTRSTPLVPGGDYSRAFVPIRLQGLAPDGSQDTFAQVLLPSAGQDGKSAYQIWLDQGHTGTQADFLASLAGAVTSSTITSALGFAPYDSANPASYVTVSGARSALSGSGAVSYDPASGTVKLGSIAQGTVLGNPAIGTLGPPSAQTIPAILGFTPVNKAGDTLTGNLKLAYAGVGTERSFQLGRAGGASTIFYANDTAAGLYDTVVGDLITVRFADSAVLIHGRIAFTRADGEVSSFTFYNRLEALAAGNYENLILRVASDPTMTIKLRHALAFAPTDTSLKAAVQGATGINDTQWAGLFA